MSTEKKVLIVEDDETLASAMAIAVKKIGYTSVITSKPDEALEILDKDRFVLVYIDCLLPQMPGMDLAKKIRKQFSAQILPIVLMSGVFTDKNTIKEMITETQAKDFLKKPFDVAEINKYLVKEATIVKDLLILNNIMNLFERIYENPEQIPNILKNIDKLNGYELPLLITSLVEMHFSGTVTLIASKVTKTTIVFSKGNITRVDSVDPQSFIGRLLLSSGYVFAEDLEQVLKVSSDKKVATRLVEENLLSPHALDEVLQIQMVLRMSKVIVDDIFSVHFEFNEPIYDGVAIPIGEFSLILEEWIYSRVSIEWLNNKLMKMMEYSMRLGISFRDNHPYLKSSLLQNLPNLLTNLNKVQSFSGLLSIYKDKEDDFYRGIYFLICGGLVVFADKVSQMSDDERFGRLLKMSARMKQMDLIEIFEFMGGKPGSTEAQVQAIHSDFTRRFLGNHNGISGIPGFSDLYNDVKKKSDMVLQLFLNPKALKQYEQKKLEKKATDQIRAETVIQETKKLLSMNQYQKAIELLQTLPQHLVLENRNLYLAWAKIGFMDSSKTKVKDMQEVETILMQTTAEEKVSAIGNFVKGLIAKQRGEFAIAKKYFETAMALDRNFIEARRELSGIVKSASEAKPPDLLKGDLKDVVSYLFKGQKKK